ncbi:MAG: M48 family metalloprotease [Elusimicrobiota bacterium]|jgi:hypothetical protein
MMKKAIAAGLIAALLHSIAGTAFCEAVLGAAQVVALNVPGQGVTALGALQPLGLPTKIVPADIPGIAGIPLLGVQGIGASPLSEAPVHSGGVLVPVKTEIGSGVHVVRRTSHDFRHAGESRGPDLFSSPRRLLGPGFRRDDGFIFSARGAADVLGHAAQMGLDAQGQAVSEESSYSWGRQAFDVSSCAGQEDAAGIVPRREQQGQDADVVPGAAVLQSLREGFSSLLPARPAAGVLLSELGPPVGTYREAEKKESERMFLGILHMGLTALPLVLAALLDAGTPTAALALANFFFLFIRRAHSSAGNNSPDASASVRGVPIDAKEARLAAASVERLRAGRSLSESEWTLLLRALPEQAEALESWTREALKAMLARMGMDASKIGLSIELDPSDPKNAGVVLRESSEGTFLRLRLGAGLLILPAKTLMGVLAHELGHVRFQDGRGHFGTTEALFSAWGIGVYALGAVVMSVMTLGLPGLLSAWKILLCWLPALAGAFCGVAVQRRKESRADAFSAWLTDPRWLADYLRGRGDEKGLDLGWFEEHPSRDERLNDLAIPTRAL